MCPVVVVLASDQVELQEARHVVEIALAVAPASLELAAAARGYVEVIHRDVQSCPLDLAINNPGGRDEWILQGLNLTAPQTLSARIIRLRLLRTLRPGA